ncbi:unnamed protein product [Victoria cruziana]
MVAVNLSEGPVTVPWKGREWSVMGIRRKIKRSTDVGGSLSSPRKGTDRRYGSPVHPTDRFVWISAALWSTITSMDLCNISTARRWEVGILRPRGPQKRTACDGWASAVVDQCTRIGGLSLQPRTESSHSPQNHQP